MLDAYIRYRVINNQYLLIGQYLIPKLTCSADSWTEQSKIRGNFDVSDSLSGYVRGTAAKLCVYVHFLQLFYDANTRIYLIDVR